MPFVFSIAVTALLSVSLFTDFESVWATANSAQAKRTIPTDATRRILFMTALPLAG
jgi:hypothetical protein